MPFDAPTRPKVRQRLHLRMATPADGEAIGRLVVNAGWTLPGIEWADLGANWLVAEYDGALVGCLEVLFGKPLGRVELLGIDPGLSPRVKAMTVKALIGQGCAVLERFGSQVACGIVGNDLPEYQRVIQKRGGQIVLRNASCFARYL